MTREKDPQPPSLAPTQPSLGGGEESAHPESIGPYKVLSQLGEAHTAVRGAPTGVHGVSYGSDLRFFTNDAGMPAVLYGPGDVAHAHTVNEHVQLTEVLDAAKTVALMLMNWRTP